MKKILCAAAALIMLLQLECSAYAVKRYSGYLKIEHGKSSIVMTVGEKRRLHVYSPVLGLPVHKGLRFSSSNIGVATVDRSGVVRAGNPGCAYVSVVDKKGRIDAIRIVVERGKKSGIVLPIVIFSCIITVCILIRRVFCR